MDCGINLFTLRSFLEDEKGFVETVEKLKKMGCDYVQCSGLKYNPELFAKVSRECDMPIVLTHVPMTRIIGEPEKLCEEHASFGCHNIGLGMMPIATCADEKLCKETLEKLNKSGEIMKKNGFNFFYHHHHFEFYRHGGETIFDYILKNEPYINFTVDTYWLQYGGASINDYAKKLKGRIECVYLKDYNIRYLPDEKDPKMEPKYEHLGAGSIDFKTVVPLLRESGAKYFLIEQDDACKYENPLAEVEASFKYAKGEL